MNNHQEERERNRQRLESYRDSEVVRTLGFQQVPVTTTGIGNIVDYLSRQDPEEGTCMNIYKSKDGTLKPDCFGYPPVKEVLELIVAAYKKSDAASFVGISSSDMGNTHSGMYFRLFFKPQENEARHYGDEDLYKGIGATKAYEIVCEEFSGANRKSRISVKKQVTEYEGAK